MPKITLDGKELEVPAGMNLIEAAKLGGVEIPYYCYHPSLSIVAQCRMCLVEVKGQHKLVPGCQTKVADGMVVNTQNQKVKTAQAAVLEFFFVNHPVDCPICDQAGECKLQDYYMKYDLGEHRSTEPRLEKPKRKVFGPMVMYDAERCILCTRCVRFTQEVTKTNELVMFHRGDHNEIGLFPGMDLSENPYSGNVVDLCPVGALTSRDFRFKVRVWTLKSAPSVCSGCATGCNVVLQHQDHQVHRVLPRENPEINRYWLCDEGRLRYHPVNEGRFLHPRVGRQDSSWTDAVTRAAETLTSQRGEVGLVLSPQSTNEDAYAAVKLAQFAGIKRLYIGGRAPGESDDFLRHADKNPNRVGVLVQAPKPGLVDDLIDDLKAKKLSALLVIGQDLTGQDQEVLAALGDVPVVGLIENESGWTDRAQVLLPIATWAEVDGHFTNAEGKSQAITAAIKPGGESEPTWRALCRLGQKLGHKMSYRSVRELQAEMRGQHYSAGFNA
jgi:NADH-quinone oxidoreductase subunit G